MYLQQNSVNRGLNGLSPRDRPLEKLWGVGVGNFQAAGNFFRYQIPCMNFFKRVLMGVPNSQLTTNFSAKYQLTTIFWANSQLTTKFRLANI